MSSSPPSPLRQRLLTARENLYTASAAGGEALRRFHDDWEALCGEVVRGAEALEYAGIDIELAQDIAQEVAIVADAFANLESRTDEITAGLFKQVDDALTTLSLDDSKPTPIELQPFPTVLITSTPTPPPPHKKIAYEWLLGNFHDPYPSASQKKSMARKMHMTPRTVDDWFKAVRRFTGWVDLCKRHFGGKRSQAVAAARRTFGSTSPQVVGVSADAVEEFTAFRIAVEKLAVGLDETARTTTPSSSSPFDIHLIDAGLSGLSDPSFTFVVDSPPPVPRTPPLVYASSSSSDSEEDESTADNYLHRDYQHHYGDSGSTQSSQARKCPSSPDCNPDTCLIFTEQPPSMYVREADIDDFPWGQPYTFAADFSHDEHDWLHTQLNLPSSPQHAGPSLKRPFDGCEEERTCKRSRGATEELSLSRTSNVLAQSEDDFATLLKELAGDSALEFPTCLAIQDTAPTPGLDVVLEAPTGAKTHRGGCAMREESGIEALAFADLIHVPSGQGQGQVLLPSDSGIDHPSPEFCPTATQLDEFEALLASFRQPTTTSAPQLDEPGSRMGSSSAPSTSHSFVKGDINIEAQGSSISQDFTSNVSMSYATILDDEWEKFFLGIPSDLPAETAPCLLSDSGTLPASSQTSSVMTYDVMQGPLPA